MDKELSVENTLKEKIASNIPEEEFQHINNPVLEPPMIVKKYLNQVSHYTKEGNSFFFYDGSATVEVKVVSDEIIRIRLAPHGSFLADFSYAISAKENGASLFNFKETNDNYQVSTNTVTCLINKSDFLISFLDREGDVYNRDDSPMHWEENPDFGGYYVYCSKENQENEGFYGLGDKPTHLNLRGKRFTNWNSDTYSFSFGQDPLYRSIPFYTGLRNGKAYGIFFDNTFKSYFDFGSESPEHTSFWSEGGELQYYYIHGPKMVDVVKRYHGLTGTNYLPPLWALGYHQCRWSYYPDTKIESLAHEFRSRKIPCDALYLDIDYMDGYRCFTWNKRHFPDPKGLIKKLAGDGFKTVVIIDPGIKMDENYWVFKEAKEKNYFCRRGDDYFMEGHVWPGRCQFPDFTNPAVREWWGGLFKGLVDDGVAGVWNDMNEPAVFGRGTFPDDVRHNYDGYRGSHRKAHNIYGMQMVRATYEGLKKLFHRKRPFTITRAGYSGTQRYGAVWTGDNVATWEHLRLGALQLQRLSVSGMSFCGTDIGGFSGNPDGELFTRWIQLGVFSPFMRAHSAGDTGEREPWSFGEYYEDINRKFIELRYQLLPYIYSAFWEQTRYGYPILRPLLMLEQGEIGNIHREEEFAFGAKLLVAPVLRQGITTKNVYLPKGRWYDFWNHSPFEGGHVHEVPTSLETMPIFVKEGAVLPIAPVMQYANEKPIELMHLRVYYTDKEINSFMYEDHGDTYAYEKDIYLEKKFTVSGDDKKMVVSQNIEGLYIESYSEYEMVFYGLPFEAKNVRIDGVVATFTAHTDGHPTLRVPKGFENILIEL